MKKLYAAILLMIIIVNVNCQSLKYYVSPSGNDNNSGLTEKTAWKSIERVNQGIFKPGDEILLQSGGIWYGNLHPPGNGEPGKPITISSFGEGSLPVINIGDGEGAGISLLNQSWWEICGIEITSGAQPRLGIRREGIVAISEGENIRIEHIVIKDCYIHDIWGQVGGDKSGIAIYVGPRVVGELKCKDCTASNILIESNIIKRVDKVGIATNAQNSVIIRGNILENLGGDGIVMINAIKGLVEYNIADRTCQRSGDPDIDTGGENWWPHTAAIWLWRCTETIMQFNEVYNTGKQARNGDGQAYDFDFDCRKCILQYNYSANNHGFLLIMNRTYDNIARYNISQNDQNHLIQMQGNIEDGNLIYNNVFYVDHSTIDIDFYCGREGDRDKSRLGATFMNNIFYATGQGRFRKVYTRGSEMYGNKEYNDSVKVVTEKPVFINNCFFGSWINGVPDDQKILFADPMFLEPGSGGRGLASLKGYMLNPGSPCINKGILVDPDSNRDFFGNPLIDGNIDIGAFEENRPSK